MFDVILDNFKGFLDVFLVNMELDDPKYMYIYIYIYIYMYDVIHFGDFDSFGNFLI